MFPSEKQSNIYLFVSEKLFVKMIKLNFYLHFWSMLILQKINLVKDMY